MSDTHSPASLITGPVTDVTIPAWDTPKNKRRPLITPGGIGRLNGRSSGGSGGGPAADTPDMSPLWGGRHDGASPALSAITAADISPYHVEDATLHTPGGGRRGRRHSLAVDETREEEMDISSAARDLREFKAGSGGARAPSWADAGSGRAGGSKAGRGKGECVVLNSRRQSGGPTKVRLNRLEFQFLSLQSVGHSLFSKGRSKNDILRGDEAVGRLAWCRCLLT